MTNYFELVKTIVREQVRHLAQQTGAMNSKDAMIEEACANADREQAAAYQDWQQARTPCRGPFPQLLLCEKGTECDDEHEHNPLPGYEDHLYECECDGCIRWYRSLK